VTERERVCEPVPHDRLHALQALNSLTTQCSGHGPRVHSCEVAPTQSAPPLAGAGLVHVRNSVPVPHVTVQPEKMVKPPLMGHAAALHGRVSSVCGHAAPPKFGDVHERVRVWLPPSHDFVHVPHCAQLPTTRSSGQSCVLHGCVSSV
jgi:hypothetical protein